MKLLKHPLEPFKQRFKATILWGTLIGIVFFTGYPLINYLSSHRQHTWGLYLPQELNIPFIPQLVWFYLALYPLLILPLFLLNSDEIKKLAKQLIVATLLAYIIFMILPCHLGFERTLPTYANYHALFLFLFNIDYPHNLVPSLHVMYSSLIIFTLNKQVTLILQLLLYGLLLGIICSTVLIHQHHLLDVISGLGLSLLIIYATKGHNREENNRKFAAADKHL